MSFACISFLIITLFVCWGFIIHSFAVAYRRSKYTIGVDMGQLGGDRSAASFCYVKDGKILVKEVFSHDDPKEVHKWVMEMYRKHKCRVIVS